MLVIRHGMLCDGSGSETLPQDILIDGNRIAEVAAPSTFDGADAQFFDAAGLLVAPGFIDAHAHGDTRKMRYPDNRSKLLQGVTTEVDGNCGFSSSCVPVESCGSRWNGLAEYAEAVNASTNTVVLCGHNSLRQHVMGNSSAPASQEQIAAMRKLLERAFESGAAGWSSGLTYFPGKFAGTAELCALSELTRNTQKIYATHMRSEGDALIEAVKEAAEIAAAGSGKLELSHLKTIFPRNYHKIDALMESIEAAKKAGLVIHADRYPYVYSSTRIGQILPAPYDRDPGISAKLKSSGSFCSEIEEALKHSPRDLATTILLGTGKTLAETAESDGTTLEHAALCALKESTEQGAAYLCMSESNLKRILSQPWVCAGSDGISMQLDDPGSSGHPRAVGSFPKFFRIVSEMLGVPEAVRKMTSLPASIFRIPGRGLIRRGYIADLAVFDAERFDSAAGFHGEPLMPAGLKAVFVNGNMAWNAAEPEKVGRFGRFIPVD